MTGIYLQGGGAKGAFQAGAIYALHELGVKFDVIASTSIGAINGYHIFRGQYQALKSLWTDVDESQMSYVREEENIIENVVLIERLRALKPYISEVTAFYVNYVNVSECRLIESYDDISQMPLEEGLARVRYSALLPKPQGVKLSRESLESFDSKYLFERFREEVIRGEYNDMSLDGGIVNNNFLEPFIQRHVDRIILIPFQPAYEAPVYIRDKYSSSNLIVIDPIESFLPMDTLRFEPHFCRLQFEAGYQRALNVWRRHMIESN